MAQRVHVVLEDDIDGTEASETLKFGLDGTAYEIDLSVENAAKLRDALAPWVGHARKVTRGRASAGRARRSEASADIRAWAKSQGMEVNSRGRVSAELREAYEAAH